MKVRIKPIKKVIVSERKDERYVKYDPIGFKIVVSFYTGDEIMLTPEYEAFVKAFNELEALDKRSKKTPLEILNEWRKIKADRGNSNISSNRRMS